MMERFTCPVDQLRAEYKQRARKNARYSLRSFARHLGVSSGRLSEILSRKSNISLKLGDKIADRLGYDPKQRRSFLRLIKTNALAKFHISDEDFSEDHYTMIESDKFQLIEEWFHLALLNLIKTTSFKFDVPWIAKRLAITTAEVRTAVERLTRLQMVEVKEGKLRRVVKNLHAGQDIPSGAIRAFHKTMLEKAIHSIESVPTEHRYLTGITIAIKKKDLADANKLIAKFAKQFSSAIDSDSGDEVYHVAVQFFPVTDLK